MIDYCDVWWDHTTTTGMHSPTDADPAPERRAVSDRAPWAVLAIATVALVSTGARVFIRSNPTTDSTPQIELIESGLGGVQLGGQPADPNATIDTVLAETARAMGAVTSVEFTLERGGAAVFIDQFGSIALDRLHGQFVAPASAQATIDVTIDANLTTRLGAVALDDEVWVSNPVTGRFETLPPGYDLDPSRFFDPTGGWQPLVENLQDATLDGVQQVDGTDRYVVNGRARAADVANITVGLISNQDVPVTLLIDPGTSLITDADFVTTIDGADANWSLHLDRYGASFDIDRPELAS